MRKFLSGDIPNDNFRLPPLEAHFGVGGCGRTDSAGGLVKNKMKGGIYNKPPYSRPSPLTCFFSIGKRLSVRYFVFTDTLNFVEAKLTQLWGSWQCLKSIKVITEQTLGSCGRF